MFGADVFLPAPAGAETLDSVVASVGYNAITHRDVIEECHFERFLEGKSPASEPSKEEEQAALNRLISQTLLAEQIQRPARASKNGAKNAEDTLKSVQEKFPNNQSYRAALQSLGMTEQQVLKRLEIYQRTLQMINNRLRPTALPDPNEVDDYYKKIFVPEYAKNNSGPPPSLDQVRDQIREILVEKKMNELLDDWLDRLKSTHRVTIHPD
jgi:peptidyl-prolyl cis-trans isomerase SurA